MASPQPPYAHPGTSNYFQHPPYAYGSHSPAPPPFQYQYPVPPMNGHARPSPSRGRGYPSSRGGHNYQNYHHHHHPPPHHQYPYAPHYPSPHSHQHNKYSHSHTPPVPFSPSYAIRPSSPYSSQWQAQQPLSPLPKHLSMLSSLSSPGPTPSQPSEQDDLAPPSPEDHAPKSDTEKPVDATSVPDAPENSDALTGPTNPPPSSPPQSPLSQHTVTSTLLTRSPTIPASSNAALSILTQSPEYVIWSRRPTDPSSAPGIIISPRARPPDNVRQKALDIPPPPASPAPIPREPLQRQTPSTSTEPIDVSSSSATETTSGIDTSVVTSPVSTNTSFSVAISSAAKVAPDTESVHAVASQVETAPLPPDQPVVEVVPAADVSASVSIPSTPPSKPTVPKPSFASLFRQADPASSKPNALPKSSVVGFSIPAASPTLTVPPVHPPKKPELLSLLTSGPSNQPFMKIRPRGLVNTGNMCFANAVLQVLIYCPPFWKLFYDLGRLLDNSSENGVSSSKTPLVDATIKFLREFIPKQKAAPEGKGKAVDRTYNAYGEEEDDIMSSFIPSYVYDALKEKKRFDHMRVRRHSSRVYAAHILFSGGSSRRRRGIFGILFGHSGRGTPFHCILFAVKTLSRASREPTRRCGRGWPMARSWQAESDCSYTNGTFLLLYFRLKPKHRHQVKTAESPITRIFGGKFRSTLRVPHQKESVVFEDWRSLRLDIQVRWCFHMIQCS